MKRLPVAPAARRAGTRRRWPRPGSQPSGRRSTRASCRTSRAYLKSDPDARTAGREDAQPRQPDERGGAADRRARLPVEQPDGGRAHERALLLPEQRRGPQPVPQGRLAARRPGHRDRAGGPERLRRPGLRLRRLGARDGDRRRSGLRLSAAAASGWRQPAAASGGATTRSAGDPQWTFLSNGFGTNAIGTLVYDAKSHTLYAGTGEPNSSGDSESGVGIYASARQRQPVDAPAGQPGCDERPLDLVDRDRSEPPEDDVRRHDPRRPRRLVGDRRLRVARAGRGTVGPLEDDRRRSDLHLGLGRPRQRPRREPRRARQPRHDLRGCVPAGHLALDERRLHAGSRSSRRRIPTENTARSEFALNTTAGGHTRIYVGDGGTEIDGQFPPHSNTRRLPRRLDRHEDVGPADQRHDQPRVRRAHRPDPRPGRSDVRLLRDPVLVRQHRRLTGRAPRHGLHRRFLRLQPVRQRHQQRPGRAAVAGRGRDLDRPDTGQRRSDDRDPPRPARAGRRSRESAALLRGLGRRRRPLERPADRRVGELQPEPRAVLDHLHRAALGRARRRSRRSTRASRRSSTRAWP